MYLSHRGAVSEAEHTIPWMVSAWHQRHGADVAGYGCTAPAVNLQLTPCFDRRGEVDNARNGQIRWRAGEGSDGALVVEICDPCRLQAKREPGKKSGPSPPPMSPSKFRPSPIGRGQIPRAGTRRTIAT